MDKASVYGTGDCRFESYQGQVISNLSWLVRVDCVQKSLRSVGISGLVVEYIVAIDVTRVRFPADALLSSLFFYPFFRQIVTFYTSPIEL